jgi:hypothetical protein
METRIVTLEAMNRNLLWGGIGKGGGAERVAGFPPT